MLNIVQEQDFTVVTPQIPQLDSNVAADFKTAFSELLASDQHFILLDLSLVDFMDSSGLAAIVFCFQLTTIGKKLAICGLNDRVEQLFTLTQMQKVVQLFSTKREAEFALAHA